MADATDTVAPALSSAQSVADPDPVPVNSTAGPAPEMVSGVAAQLEVVVGAARPGGLSGVSSEQALQVVEAVEVVKCVG